MRNVKTNTNAKIASELQPPAPETSQQRLMGRTVQTAIGELRNGKFMP